MRKLRAWYYLKNNKKRGAILSISFGLYIALLYGVRFFINPMFYTDEAVYLANAERMQSVYVNDLSKLSIDLSLWEDESDATQEEMILEINRGMQKFASELEKDQRIDYVFACSTYGINIHTLTSSSYYRAPMVTKEQAKILCDYNKVELLEGTYPQQPGDIILDKNMAKNLKVTIGDTIFDKSTKVCGIVASKGYFAVGIEYDDLIVKRNLFFLNQGRLTDLNQYFKEIGWEATEKDSSELQIVSDVITSKKLVQNFKEELQQPLNVMVFVITLVMGITLYLVYQLHVKDRYEEWCLYRSFGYSKREVFQLAFREYGICLLGGLGFALFSLLIIFISGSNMMKEQGIVYRYFMPETFWEIVAVMIFMTGVLQIPVLKAMNRITTIDAIEDDI